jgi:hypothetical protein
MSIDRVYSAKFLECRESGVDFRSVSFFSFGCISA